MRSSPGAAPKAGGYPKRTSSGSPMVPGDEHGELSLRIAKRTTREAIAARPWLHRHRDDLLSEACWAAAKARLSHDPTRNATLEEWLLHHCRWHLLSWLRRKLPLTATDLRLGRTLDTVPEQWLDPLLTDTFPTRALPVQPQDAVEDRDEVDRLLACLPRRQRQVLEALYLDDLDANLLARYLGLSAYRVREIAREAIRALRAA